MPATLTAVFLSSAVPSQLAPGSCYRASATNISVPTGLNFPAFNQGALNPADLNEMIVDLANIARFGGQGCGVAFGLTLSSSSGLTVNVAAGGAVGPGGWAEMPAAGTRAVSDSATSYIWLTTAGALTSATSTAPPTNAAIYLGAATAVAGVVTNIDTGGVVNLAGGRPLRVTGDRGYPVDAPLLPMLTRTRSGLYEWDMAAWRAIGTPTDSQTIAGPLTLAATSAPRQVVNGGASNRNVLVPSSRISDGVLEIHNSGSTNSLLVRDSGDTTTLITLTAGQGAVLYPHFGATAYPAATAI